MTDAPPPYDEDLDELVERIMHGSLTPHEYKLELQALLLRAQIAELKLARDWIMSSPWKNLGEDPSKALVLIGERLAALQQQLKEVEGKDK